MIYRSTKNMNVNVFEFLANVIKRYVTSTLHTPGKREGKGKQSVSVFQSESFDFSSAKIEIPFDTYLEVDLCYLLSMNVDENCLDSDDAIDNNLYPPPNFSWIIDEQLAAMGCPNSHNNIEYLHRNGIHHLITLSPEKIPPMVDTIMEWTFIPIEEFEAPTIRDINNFIDICQKCLMKNEAVGVHCRMGRGRTGTMAACFLVRFEGLIPDIAIAQVRSKRPGSVETYSQERSVVRYHDYCRGTIWNDNVTTC